MLSKLSKRFKKWSKKREDIAQLRAMSDRDLADIGIRRYDIERVIEEGQIAD